MHHPRSGRRQLPRCRAVPVAGQRAHPPPLREQARRHRAALQTGGTHILAAAGALIAQSGAEASLEEIARRAEVGSATLHRHFPSRQALLEAVFRDRVEALCARARELAADADAEAALATWLRAVGAHAVANRGLAAALLRSSHLADPTLGATCHAMIVDAGEELLSRACRAHAVRPGVAITDLLKVVAAISMATEQEPEGSREAERLVTLVIDGFLTSR